MRRLLGLITAVLMIGVVAVPALAGGGNEDNTNSVGYWCGSEEDGTKYDNLEQETFTVPAPPEGKVYTMAVVKAGSEQSVDNPNHVVENPVEGDVLSHPSGKDISHVILCWEDSELIETSVSISGECRLVDGEAQGFIDAEVGEGAVLSIDGDPFGPGSYDDLTVIAPGTYPWEVLVNEGYVLVGESSGEVVIEDCSETTTTTVPEETTTTVPEETTTTEQETTTTTEASTTTTEQETTTTTEAKATSTTEAPAPDGDAGNPLPWAIPVGAVAMLVSLFGLALRGRTE